MGKRLGEPAQWKAAVATRGGDGVVGVGVEAAVAAEGEDDVGAKDADALDEIGGEVERGW